MWLRPLEKRTAHKTAQACFDALEGVRPTCISFDDGKEFTQHVAIAEGTDADADADADVYFARIVLISVQETKTLMVSFDSIYLNPCA